MKINVENFFRTVGQTQVDVEHKSIDEIFFTLEIPMIELFESSEDSSTIEICQERLRISLDRLVLAGESLIKKKLSIDLRILVCFMCGGEKNDVEILIDHLASRFTLNCVNQSSFLINVVVGRANRKVKQRKKKSFLKKLSIFFLFCRSNSFVFRFIRYSMRNFLNSMVLFSCSITTELLQFTRWRP